MKPRKSVIYVPEYMYPQEFQVQVQESSFVGRREWLYNLGPPHIWGNEAAMSSMREVCLFMFRCLVKIDFVRKRQEIEELKVVFQTYNGSICLAIIENNWGKYRSNNYREI